MTHEEAFREAILDEPHADGPRLVYADWLEDHAATDDGRARAELIRVQCRLADSPPEAEREVLRAREARLLHDHALAWLGALANAVESWRFERGMACVRLRAARFISPTFQTLAAAWFPRAGVTGLELRGGTAHRARLFGSPLLAGVHRLRLDETRMLDRHVRELAAGAAHLRRLTSLAVRNCGNSWGLGPAALQALADSPHLRALREIDFHLFPLREGALDVLTGAPAWPGLESVNLGHTRLGPDGVGRLLQAPWLHNLKGLGLYACLPSDELVCALLGSPHLGRLRWLDLGGYTKEDAAVEAVAACPALSELRWLSLRFARMSAATAEKLARSPHLQNLGFLDLYGLGEDRASAEILEQRFGAALHLEYTPPG
jgi:uncharacterized protein (TIGR02996 family)